MDTVDFNNPEEVLIENTLQTLSALRMVRNDASSLKNMLEKREYLDLITHLSIYKMELIEKRKAIPWYKRLIKFISNAR